MNSAATTATSSTLSSTIFLVEDEPVLRSSLANGLSKMGNVDVLAAGSVDEAVAFLDERSPSLLISDIDLPGPSGLELVAELGRREIHVPIILITAYLDAYRNQIPAEPNLFVLEKPIPLQDLRMRVQQALLPVLEELRPPFNLIDCVQQVRASRLSVRIEIELGGGPARVIIHKGEVWAAMDDRGAGTGAFQRLAFVPDSAISCVPLFGDPGPRNITMSWERLVLDLACSEEDQPQPRVVEIGPDDGGEAPAGRRAFKSLARTLSGMPQVPPECLRASPAGPTFDELWADGVDALLKRQYAAAVQAFRAAGRLRYGHRGVLANLQRLEEMGYGEDSVSEESD